MKANRGPIAGNDGEPPADNGGESAETTAKNMGDGSVTLKDVLAKAAKGDELTDEEKTFLAGYEEPDVDAIANSRSKKERLRLEKKIAEQAEALTEAQEELANASSGTELEKAQRDLEKAQAKLEKAAADLEQERTAHGATRRGHDLARLGAQIPWMDGIGEDIRNAVVAKAFGTVDADDLGDDSVTGPVIQNIIEANKGVIKSDAARGAGTGGEAGRELGKKETTYRVPNLAGKGPAEGQEAIKAIWAADKVATG